MKFAIRKCKTRAAAMAAATRNRKTSFKSPTMIKLQAKLDELDEEIQAYHRRH